MTGDDVSGVISTAFGLVTSTISSGISASPNSAGVNSTLIETFSADLCLLFTDDERDFPSKELPEYLF